MKRYYSLFAAALVAASCSKDNVQMFPVSCPDTQTQQVEIKITPFIGDETKSSISASGDFAWTAGDSFGVYPLSTTLGKGQSPQQVSFHIQEEEAGTNDGTFTGTGFGLITGGGYKYFAYYPYDAKAQYDKISVSYKYDYNVRSNSSTAHIAEDYLISSTVTPENPSDAVFVFKHLGALVNFRMLLPEDARSISFNQLEIRCGEPVFASEGYYSPIDAENLEFTATSSTSAITATLNNISADSEGYVNFYAMLPPSALGGKTLSITLKGSSGIYVCERTMNGDILSGYKYAPVFTMKKRDLSKAVNLSSASSANCYVISPSAGLYYFRADIKGNGYDPFDDASHSKAAPLTGGDHAEIIWQMDNSSMGASLISDVLYEDNKIYFTKTTDGIYGRALISLKNSSDVIIWSWMIWITDAIAEIRVGDYTMMDRNLGATSSAVNDGNAVGLLYQWGKPWPCAGVTSAWKGVKFGENSKLSYVSMANGLKEPSATHTNWSSSIGTLWTVTKTMYDPSPIGWKVAPAAFYSNFSKGNTTIVNYGRTLTENTAAYFPYVGCVNLNSFAIYGVKTQANYWTCERSSAKASQAVGVGLSSSKFGPTSAYSSAYGFAIRCTKE